MAAFAMTLSLCGFPPNAHSDDAPHTPAFFEHHIRPILATRCLKCHGEKKQEGELRLDSLAAMIKGGESGPAIVKGKLLESPLIEAINYQGLEMPPTGQLSAGVIKQFEQWITAGAAWPEHSQQIR